MGKGDGGAPVDARTAAATAPSLLLNALPCVRVGAQATKRAEQSELDELYASMFNGKDSYGAIGLGSGARTLASVCFDVRSAASAARRASSNAARSAR